MHRQAIHRGRVAYEPNSLGGGCPFQAGAAGFVSMPERMERESHKVRGKAERFADHYTQATLFWNSQTDVEKTHIVNAFRFELSHVQTPAIRERMVSGLMNVAPELADAVARGLGIRDMPAPMPKVLQKKVKAEVTTSPALSLFARPGDGSVRARRVAIAVADGVNGDAARALAARLTAAGAVPRFIASRLGRVESAAGDPIEVDVTLEATPAVLYDAVVVADGNDVARRLAADGRAVEFLKDQYRHCKPIFAVGSSSALLEKAGIPPKLPSGKPDPGLVVGRAGDVGSEEAFIKALAKHRHFARETDPPLV
jgi:catalase